MTGIRAPRQVVPRRDGAEGRSVASQYQIKSGMHGPTDISPVGMAAGMHVGVAIHKFGIEEHMMHGDKTNRDRF